MQTETRVQPAQLVVIDETPLWLAWQMAIDAFIDSRRRNSAQTAAAYKADLDRFFRWANCQPWDVSTRLANDYARHLRAQGRAEATINRRLSALSALYRYVATRYQFTSRDGDEVSLWPADRVNPFDTVARARISPYGRANFPTTDELRAILASPNTAVLRGKRDFALLFTFATTCLRCSAVLGMHWGDLHPRDDGAWTLAYTYKGGSARKCVLPRAVYAAICAYLRADGRPPQTMQPGDHVWIAIDPERITRLPQFVTAHVDPARHISPSLANRILKKHARRAGVDPAKAHLHALRHAGARLRVEQMIASGRGVDYGALMDVLGHSSLAITQIYSQNVLEDPEDPGADQAAAALLPRHRPGRTASAQHALFDREAS